MDFALALALPFAWGAVLGAAAGLFMIFGGGSPAPVLSDLRFFNASL